LWFGEAQVDRIGRIAVNGTFSGDIPLGPGSPGVSSVATGLDGALYASLPKANQIARVGTGGAVTTFNIPSPNSQINAIATGADGKVWFTEGSANKIGRLTPPAPPSPLVTAVLPESRSALAGGQPVTAFATLINAGTLGLSGCGIVPLTSVPAGFLFQTTNPNTNAVTGTANTRVALTAGGSQSFVIAFSANAPFIPINVALGFDCANVDGAATINGVNSLLLSAASVQPPDIVALAAAPGNDGILRISGNSGSAAFAIATLNVGSGTTVVVSANTGPTALPLTLSVCQTVPFSGACQNLPAATVAAVSAANATPTFAVFAIASDAIPLQPAANRIFVQFTDPSGQIRGLTSVAVQTQ